ncbi:MAG: type II toxin-antitoxin system RelE/ParE family toxin [Candidatus Competibacteraceae bacterium]
MKIRFLQPAERELGEAVEYYEAQKPGLGFELFEEVWAAIERIEQYPEAWQPVSPRARRCQTHRFPYGVIYQIREKENEILIVAVSHLHRKPSYWQNRI